MKMNTLGAELFEFSQGEIIRLVDKEVYDLVPHVVIKDSFETL